MKWNIQSKQNWREYLYFQSSVHSSPFILGPVRCALKKNQNKTLYLFYYSGERSVAAEGISHLHKYVIANSIEKKNYWLQWWARIDSFSDTTTR